MSPSRLERTGELALAKSAMVERLRLLFDGPERRAGQLAVDELRERPDDWRVDGQSRRSVRTDLATIDPAMKRLKTPNPLARKAGRRFSRSMRRRVYSTRRAGQTAWLMPPCLLAGLLLVASSVSAQQLTVESVDVDPSAPGAKTLCRLSVVIKNTSEKPASALGFQVRLNGQALPVYDDQLFYQLLPAGQSSEVALFNFWVSETGRPAPATGKLVVEVELVEAQWFDVTTKTTEGVEEEVWDPVGKVTELPSKQTRTLDIK